MFLGRALRVLLLIMFSVQCSTFNVYAQLNPDVDRDTTRWFNRTQHLGNVDVSAQRSRYSRRNNPAVELMRRVIAAKQETSLKNRDYYQYNKYQKLTLAINEITPRRMEDPQFKSKPWLADQVEFCPYNYKLILPISVDETVTQHVYRKSPKAAKDIIKGQETNGINQLIETGNILNAMLKDVFHGAVAVYAANQA